MALHGTYNRTTSSIIVNNNIFSKLCITPLNRDNEFLASDTVFWWVVNKDTLTDLIH